jgi:hypothetical protein
MIFAGQIRFANLALNVLVIDVLVIVVYIGLGMKIDAVILVLLFLSN